MNLILQNFELFLKIIEVQISDEFWFLFALAGFFETIANHVHNSTHFNTFTLTRKQQHSRNSERVCRPRCSVAQYYVDFFKLQARLGAMSGLAGLLPPPPQVQVTK